ncbi:MAG: VOC family protein [Chloroflexi bacterium]|nr:VOC family protein [Chloroflexota bacterium]
MYTVKSYPHGTFCWAECTSTDTDAAKPFYTGLFGWKATDDPVGEGMIYTRFSQGGHDVAALSPMRPDQGDMPSHWNTHINVDDVHALPDRVRELGGTVIVEPFDVLDAGHMMVIADPTGAAITLWQAKNHIGAGLVNTAGAMVWNELNTTDAEAAKTFYGELLGWTFHKMADMDYWVIDNQGRGNGGIMEITEDMGDMPPAWMVYFTVEDVDAAFKRVKELGGSTITEVMEGPGMRFVVAADPAGAAFYLMESDELDTWPQDE